MAARRGGGVDVCAGSYSLPLKNVLIALSEVILSTDKENRPYHITLANLEKQLRRTIVDNFLCVLVFMA